MKRSGKRTMQAKEMGKADEADLQINFEIRAEKEAKTLHFRPGKGSRI